MRHITLRRTLPVETAVAFAWFTDYTPDDSAIFGDPPGGREVERLGDGRLRLRNRYPGSRLSEETEVILHPPDSWEGAGTLYYGRFRVAEYTQKWILSNVTGGCELLMSLDLDITSYAVRIYLFLRPNFISDEIEKHYDRIKESLIRDMSETPSRAPSST